MRTLFDCSSGIIICNYISPRDLQVHVMGDKLMFFIEDNRAASSLKKYGEMETRDGPLSIYVKPSPPPKGSSGGGGRGGGRGGGGGGSDGSDSGESGGVGSYHQRQRGGRGNRRGRGGVFSRVDGDISMEEDASAVVKVSVIFCVYTDCMCWVTFVLTVI